MSRECVEFLRCLTSFNADSTSTRGEVWPLLEAYRPQKLCCRQDRRSRAQRIKKMTLECQAHFHSGSEQMAHFIRNYVGRKIVYVLRQSLTINKKSSDVRGARSPSPFGATASFSISITIPMPVPSLRCSISDSSAKSEIMTQRTFNYNSKTATRAKIIKTSIYLLSDPYTSSPTKTAIPWNICTHSRSWESIGYRISVRLRQILTELVEIPIRILVLHNTGVIYHCKYFGSSLMRRVRSGKPSRHEYRR